jgi:hypothetical protein
LVLLLRAWAATASAPIIGRLSSDLPVRENS